MKGTAKAITNLKPMAGGAAIAQLPVGGWVFGDVGLTDLTGFSHYYLPEGTKIELGQPCKAWKANLILSDEQEPVEPPPVDPPDEPVELTQFDIIRQVREGIPQPDGKIEWKEYMYEGVKFIADW